MATVWLDVWDACRIVGRSPKTLQRWRLAGLVRVGRNRDGKLFYDKQSLVSARKQLDLRQEESQIQNRNRRRSELAGPGRGHRKPVWDGAQLVLWL
jgi:transposase-like protein